VKLLRLLLPWLVCAASGCTVVTADPNPRFSAEYPPVPCAARSGSLWRPGAASFVADPVARARGDVVTVLVRESQEARQQDATTLEQTTSADAHLDGLDGLPSTFRKGLPGASVGSTRRFTADGEVTKNGRVTTRVTAVVTDVLPNGCLVVEGTRQVSVDDETRVVHVAGIVRPQDLTPANTVLSEQLAEATVSLEGRGPVTRNGSRGMVGSAVDFLWHHLWPF
jgi:flagellar L-ring protein precursor FlgH